MYILYNMYATIVGHLFSVLTTGNVKTTFLKIASYVATAHVVL